jgi:hypothetical protein
MRVVRRPPDDERWLGNCDQAPFERPSASREEDLCRLKVRPPSASNRPIIICWSISPGSGPTQCIRRSHQQIAVDQWRSPRREHCSLDVVQAAEPRAYSVGEPLEQPLCAFAASISSTSSGRPPQSWTIQLTSAVELPRQGGTMAWIFGTHHLFADRGVSAVVAYCAGRWSAERGCCHS